MKHAFGGLLGTRRHYTHSWNHETLVDLLALQQEIHSGIFAVMDGTLCGNGPGPRTMEPVEKDYMLAGSDQVAIDAVAAKINTSIGKRMALTYQQHKWIPNSCFCETEYFVTDVRVTE